MVDDRPVLLERLISGAARYVETSVLRKRVQIDIRRFHRYITVRCDEAAVSRAIGNLLRNAVEHAPAGSCVTIAAEQRDDNVLAIAVADNGAGADPAMIAACLRPLDRVLEPERDDSPRTGLGLPMAKAIVQAHGGTLEISTAPSEGTVAIIVLPAEIVEVRHEHAA